MIISITNVTSVPIITLLAACHAHLTRISAVIKVVPRITDTPACPIIHKVILSITNLASDIIRAGKASNRTGLAYITHSNPSIIALTQQTSGINNPSLMFVTCNTLSGINTIQTSINVTWFTILTFILEVCVLTLALPIYEFPIKTVLAPQASVSHITFHTSCHLISTICTSPILHILAYWALTHIITLFKTSLAIPTFCCTCAGCTSHRTLTASIILCKVSIHTYTIPLSISHPEVISITSTCGIITDKMVLSVTFGTLLIIITGEAALLASSTSTSIGKEAIITNTKFTLFFIALCCPTNITTSRSITILTSINTISTIILLIIFTINTSTDIILLDKIISCSTSITSTPICTLLATIHTVKTSLVLQVETILALLANCRITET